MEIPKKINDEIWDYCRANNIPNINDFMIKLLQQGFTSEKFGATPARNTVIEKIVEVPVEKIVEKVIEVPINVTDTALTEKYNAILKENVSLKTEIEALKKNNKRDIYGE